MVGVGRHFCTSIIGFLNAFISCVVQEVFPFTREGGGGVSPLNVLGNPGSSGGESEAGGGGHLTSTLESSACQYEAAALGGTSQRAFLEARPRSSSLRSSFSPLALLASIFSLITA